MKKLFFFVFCFFCILSFGSVCQAEEVATGSAVTSEFDSNNFSTEMELDDLETSDLFKIFSIGFASGIGLITILYILAIAIASFFTITELVE